MATPGIESPLRSESRFTLITPAMIEYTKDFRRLEGLLGDNGRLGVSAKLFDTHGELLAQVVYRGNDPFPMASVVKVPIGMAIELMSRQGLLSLDEPLSIHSKSACPGPLGNPLDRLFFLPWESECFRSVSELLELMLIHSDNTAADALLARIGGPSTIQSFVSTSGVRGITVNRSIAELLTWFYDLPDPLRGRNILDRTASIGRAACALRSAYRSRPAKELELVETAADTTTPEAMTRLIHLAFSDSKFRRVQQAMNKCRTGSERIPSGLKACGLGGARIAHKTGSLGGITNDIGVATRGDETKTALSILTWGATVSCRTRDFIIAETTEVIMRSLECW